MGSGICRSVVIAVSTLSVLLFVQAASAETWSGFYGGSDANSVRASQPASNLGIAWRTTDSNPSLQKSCTSYGDGVVYTFLKDPDTGDFRTLALDAANGAELWVSGNYNQVAGCPQVGNESVFIGYRRKSDNQWVAASLDRSDGSSNWESDPVSLASTETMALGAGHLLLFAGSQLVAIDLTDGTESWRQPGKASDSWSGPLVSGGTVIASGVSGGLVAYGIAAGDDKGWVTNSGDNILGSATRGGMLYHRRGAGTVVARDVSDGSEKWTRPLGAATNVSNIVADANRVYAHHGSNSDIIGAYKVAAMDAATGSFAWSENFSRGFFGANLQLLGDWLYTAADDLGSRWMLNPSTGEAHRDSSGFPVDPFDRGFSAYGDRSFFQWQLITTGINAGAWEMVSYQDTVAPQLTVTSPASGSYRSGNLELGFSADDGFATPVDRFEVRVDEGPVTVLAGQATTHALDLAPGVHIVELAVIDLDGNRSEVEREIGVIPAPVPVAGVVGPSEPVLTGNGVRFDASSSRDEVLDGQIETYEWDLDGNGSFETSSSGAVLQAEFAKVGVRPVTVKVTNDSGNSDTAAVNVDVRRKPLPGAGAVGISINGAELFTNDPNVKLKIKWPALATDLAVSNDGGFATSTSFQLPANGFVEWKLDSSGPERLPKTVYARYYGAGTDTVTFTDDIILDETPPVIEQAKVVVQDAATSLNLRSLAPAVSISRVKRRYRVRIKARDSTSGVVAIQVARSRKAKGPVVRIGNRARRLKKLVNPRVRFRPRLIRVKDAAGNWSRFRKIR